MDIPIFENDIPPNNQQFSMEKGLCAMQQFTPLFVVFGWMDDEWTFFGGDFWAKIRN
jgi:hypothetical protein